MKLTRYLLPLILISVLAGCGKQSDTQFKPEKPLLVFIATTGDSMLPTFPNPYIVQIDIAYDYDKLAISDIVVFWDYKRKGFTLHRIVAKQGDWFITKGDNPETNPVVDPPFVTRDNFIGKYVGP